MEFNEEVKLCEAILEGKEIHGHTKIELTDVNTGKTEVYEHDNIVTNAVRNIFRDNYLGLLDISKITPMREMFSGVLCFGQTNTANIDNIRVPSEDSNPLIAHAGNVAHATASTLRGNPNGVESGEITGGYKFVWDFSTTQGNGTISSLSLTSGLFGNCGTKPYDNSTKAIFDVGLKAHRVNGYAGRDRVIHGAREYLTDDGTAIGLYQSADTIEEITLAYNTIKFYLNNTAFTPEEIDSRTVTLAKACDLGKGGILEDSTNYYVIEIQSNGGNYVKMNTIKKSDFSVVDSSFTAAGASLWRFDIQGDVLRAWEQSPYMGCDGTYLYLPSTDYTFYRINLSNTADITKLDSNLTSWVNAPKSSITPVSEKFLVGYNFVINGDSVYQTANAFDDAYDTTISIAGDTYPNKYTSGDCYARPIVLPYLATINNLDSAVTKSSSQTMKITYSITES